MHFATLNRHGNIVKELLAARAAQVADHDGGKLRVLEQTHFYQVFNLEQFDKYSTRHIIATFFKNNLAFERMWTIERRSSLKAW